HELEARLGPGGEHAAHRDVICAVVPGASRLVFVVGRYAEEHARAQEPAGVASGQIVLAHVNAVRLDSEGEVDTVIDDEETSRLTAAASEGSREQMELDGRKALFAELDDPAASGEHPVQNRRQFTPRRGAPVENHVEGRGKRRRERKRRGQGPTSRRGSV